ncbi:type II toxin-antitoxin system HicB family antitoxin [Neisseria chenwenguii]|uniref:HicB family protein n=1 Tax=Neisseria chenwenguii TaxID=1853278 RepID=A0A220S2H7_9NEIS|nr:type II toxin-antitoxin system HicB family antitoxin [Neisseria chenwenguii]ASK27647.1 HicB family protein [Neisseria chenwenguii]ROV55734.1 type II toxin-antitoxin system HicB family antitoxin [Neisseria chenwenguii]
MFIPVAIHKDEESIFGVSVPDLPGCFSYGETEEEALHNTRQAVVFHVEGMLADGEFDSLTPSRIADLQESGDYDGATWALVDVDLSKISNKQTRFNVSWPEYLLRRVDAYAAAHHETRSGFLAKAAQQMLQQQS